MTTYTKLTKYEQLKDGMRVRWNNYSEGDKFTDGEIKKDRNILKDDQIEEFFNFIPEDEAYMEFIIQEDNFHKTDLELFEEIPDNPKIFTQKHYEEVALFAKHKIAELLKDEPEPTIQSNQWYTPQEILEYVKADPRADEEKRFMIKVESGMGENYEQPVGAEKSLRADLSKNYINTDRYVDTPELENYRWIESWTDGTYKGKMQFIHWCDENWKKLTEKPLEQGKSDTLYDTDVVESKNYEIGGNTGKSEPAQTHLIKIVEKQLPENCKNTVGHFEFYDREIRLRGYAKYQINLTINYETKTYSITTPNGNNFIFKSTKNNNLEVVKLLQQALTFAQKELGIK
jgi:hypothetical protein